MHALHIYSGNLFGGVERMLITLAESQHFYPAMEHQFALCFHGRLSDELHAVGAVIHRLGTVRVSQFWTVSRARRSLRQLLRQRSFDVVICHSAWAQAIFAPVAKRAKLPLVFWLHGLTNGRHWLERWARRTPPDISISNSHFTTASLQHMYAEVRAELLYCPVTCNIGTLSLHDRNKVRRELATEPDDIVIIQASRMETWKGHSLHISALGRLRHLSNWVCWQVGGAQRPQERRYVETLQRMAAQNGVAERIRFLGQRSDVARLMSAADIHCQPNQQPEPFGIAFIEALAAQLPVVTTAMGGALEIVDDTCGLLVPANDVQSLADSLQRLIQSPMLRTRLGAAGPLRAYQLCDPVQQVSRLHTLLTDFLRHKGKR